MAKGAGAKVVVRDMLDIAQIRERADILKGNRHNVVIIDDFLDTKELDTMSELYTAGRWLNISVFTLIQSYYRLPQAFRMNATDIFIFPLGQNARYTLQALPTFGIITTKRLIELYGEICNEGQGAFLWICCDPFLPKIMRIRKRFDEFLSEFLPFRDE
jgi:hypothetical protein